MRIIASNVYAIIHAKTFISINQINEKDIECLKGQRKHTNGIFI